MKDFGRKARINAVKILYIVELLGCSKESALKSVFDNEEIDEEASLLVDAITQELPIIDELITNSLVNYSLNRLSYVDRAIIRVATYEMLHDQAKEIAINEAIEITKIYTDLGDQKAKAFNNRLLDNISKRLADGE